MTEPRKASVPASMLPELCYSLMERSPIPVIELEGPGHIIRYVNPAFCRLVRKNADALTGKSFTETVQEGDRCVTVLTRVYRTGESETHTGSDQIDPHPFIWSYAIWPVLDATQRPVGLMMQITETTLFHQQAVEMNQQLLMSSVHQHERTEAAEKLNDELERRVSERTKALEQSEAHLRTLATELNLAEQRERTRLSAELHDYLAQLLVLGRMTLSQAKRSGLPSRGEELVKETEETLGKALTYCRTLITELSPPVLQEHGLPAGLLWLADHMKRQELAVTVEIQEALDVRLPEDRAVLLFQSVRELLINVAKHGTVKKAMVRMTYEDGALRLIVRDDNGFDLALVPAGSDDSSVLSSKFGLFSIRERMKVLGGSFDISTSPGNGTTVTLTLPVASRTEESGARSESAKKGIDPEPTVRPPSDRPIPRRQSSVPKQAATIRVLLVDDQTLMREGLRSIVSAYSHLEVVGEAEDGEEAVTFAERLDPDVILMDINMPKMDGLEATRRIKRARPGIVIIGLSVLPSPETGQKMKAAGATAYLTKESAADALCQAIEEAMGAIPPSRQAS
jgi:signal transduction histidine kinase/CheY-like chemotaxis protein